MPHSSPSSGRRTSPPPVADLLAGRSQLAGELSHLPLVVGVLGLALARPARRRQPPAPAAPSGGPGGPGRLPPPTPATG